MAGGIDWFRWHHGSATDPKFRVVAKQAKCKTAEVVAVWAFILEAASENDSDRGSVDSIDFEAVDTAFDLDEGVAERIYLRMVARELLDDNGRVASWDKRQPKREDDTAADRKRRQRAREAEDCHAPSRTVTPAQAVSRTVTTGHDRGEERRVEKKEESPHTQSAHDGASTCEPPDPDDLGLSAETPEPQPDTPAANRPRIVHITPGIVVQVPGGERLPVGWRPLPRQVQLCTDKGYDPAETTAAFTAHARDKGRLSDDWYAAFDRWIQREDVMRAQQRSTYRGRASPPLPTDPKLAAQAIMDRDKADIDAAVARAKERKRLRAAQGGATA